MGLFKKELSSEEIIKRIEMAPKEVQVMVAKAFIRDDIDNDNVQYMFNEDTPEDMNDEGVEIENENAEEPVGIGAGEFEKRTAKPGAGNKNYIVVGSGGWNTCIKGNPMDKDCNALANCVGYASGRFNEIINDARGTALCTYKGLNCNAVDFKERAEKAGLETGMEPRVGAIMCWGKNPNKAGHVAIVEEVIDNNTVYTSESGWGSSKIFWNSKRNNDNGRWGLNTNYYFRCFIYLPKDVQDIITPELPEITPTVERNIYVDQLETLKEMNVRVGIETTSQSLGMVPKGNIYNYYKCQQGKSSKWYAITPDETQWIAGVNNNGTKYCAIYPAQPIPEPTPEPEPIPAPTPEPVVDDLKVGDKVKIIGTGNGSSYGTSNTAGGIGWTRQVLKIWNGRPYPYQIGNKSGTTGFYKRDALKKI